MKGNRTRIGYQESAHGIAYQELPYVSFHSSNPRLYESDGPKVETKEIQVKLVHQFLGAIIACWRRMSIDSSSSWILLQQASNRQRKSYIGLYWRMIHPWEDCLWTLLFSCSNSSLPGSSILHSTALPGFVCCFDTENCYEILFFCINQYN